MDTVLYDNVNLAKKLSNKRKGETTMTNEELTKIREDKKLGKKEFAALLGITPMILGKYEKGTLAIPESVAEKLKEVEDNAAATEIEVKKTTRKTARKAKEAVETAIQSDAVVAGEIEVKKTVRKAGRAAKKKAEETITAAKETVKEAFGIPNITIQSPMGGYITPADIAKKVPKDTTDVYVRVDENKLYYVLKNGETGDMVIWE